MQNYNSKFIIIKKLEEILGEGHIEVEKNLFSFLTLRTHTIAGYFFEAKSRDDLIKAKKASLLLELPLLIIGGGSNIAFTTSQINGLIVRNLYQNKTTVKDEQGYVEIMVSSGYLTPRLVMETIEAGYEGFEYHKGLPGTIGGAIFMNSKWIHPLSYFSDNLIYANLLDTKGDIKKENKDYFKFAYDYSVLQETGEIMLEALFRLKKIPKEILIKRSKEAFDYRSKTQPAGVSTSGCFFRNISSLDQQKRNLPTTSAGYLIDKAGLKNANVGSYSVSDKHANFIINKGNGHPEDLTKLLRIIKDTVNEKFGIELKEEVVLI